ncbi:hypothetical protein [Oceanicoccus sagamiensis]|uniref:Uncharacterized protein n=1 Tax=Oceanicoccus sagamiensis TaxID=716816 RepID=A0A1X9NB28_9GAMM|nr:hypothetical protein [Oceanicoccus sagamiensis]ARN74254.1 hypothetical protein BST96_09055 [Oceanicoccus sagamiensis]
MVKTLSTLTQFGLFLLVAPTLAAKETPAIIDYGHISAIEVTTEQSAIARNTVLGGLAGIAIGDNTAWAFHGAAAAFAITSIAEGDRRVFLYTVTFKGNSSKEIAIPQAGLAVGQCVAWEKNQQHINLRPVSAVYCQSPDHAALQSDAIKASQQSMAQACNKAIEKVHSAKSDSEIDQALIQMRALCE